MSEEHLRGVASTFDRILGIVVKAPSTSLAQMDYFGEYDKRRVRGWNSVVPGFVEECVHDVVERQVLLRADHEAINAWDGKMSYNELWQYTQKLAEVLISLGVGHEVCVPLCFDKSMWTIVAMLGVLKAGGAFSLLDPAQPTSRLKTLTDKLGAKILLCSRRHATSLEGVAAKVKSVSSEALRKLPDVDVVRGSGSSPSSLAYVHWTSGSTGEPKGVVIEHRAYCSSAKAHAPVYNIHSGSRVLQYASYAFDASIIEILTTLMMGGTVCVPSEDTRRDDVAGAINEMYVDTAYFTPSVINFLRPHEVPSLQNLMLAGEAMSRDNIDVWQNVRLVNAYGPAECSVSAVANTSITSTKQPTQIGHGHGVACWVVNAENHEQRMPVGSIGELLIQGPTLARGYLSDPVRTSDAFIETPTWSSSGGRFYKTGDLVRQSPLDGTFFFAGRKDSQVKLHGQRIELGEIEHCLTADKDVYRSIAVLPTKGPCKQKLVSIIMLRSSPMPTSAENNPQLSLATGSSKNVAKSAADLIRGRISTRLPAFMTPSVWLVVNSMPLLRSGKLDRKSVTSWVNDLSESEYSNWTGSVKTEERNATELEQRLRLMWSHVLNLRADQISLQQSFLGAGGDSISAMMLRNHGQKQGLDMRVQDILRARSITHLASLTHAVDSGINYEETIEEDFDLSPIQVMYFDLPREQGGHFNQSFFLRLTRHIQPESVCRAVKAIVSRHSMLRSRFRLSADDEEWKQRITMDITGSFRFDAHELKSKEDTIPIISKRQASLNPVEGPLFAADLFNLGADDQLVFLVGHHLVLDLVSWRVILEDLEELLLNPEVNPKVATGVPFQAWCRMQTENSHKSSPGTVLPSNEIPPQSYAYWGIDGHVNKYGEMTSQGFEIDAKTTSLILNDSHNALRTDTVDILIAAMIHSFSQIFRDRPAPTIFNESHGREVWDDKIDLARTVGWFTCMYPIFVSNDKPLDFFDVLRRVKDYRRQVPGNGRPYFASRLLTSKGSKKFKRHWPLEFTFNYLGVYQQLERDDGLLLPAKDMAGEARGAGGIADVGQNTPSFGLFETSAVVVQGKLRFSFIFNQHIKFQERIANWISECQTTLQVRAKELSQLAYQPTLMDFPLLSLSYESLKHLTTEKLPHLGISDLANLENIYRCTQIQQDLLISTQRDAGHYAVHGIYRVKLNDGSTIDVPRLAKAWQDLVNRHPSLRTIFVESLSQDNALYDQIVLRNVKARVVYLEHGSESPFSALESQAPMVWSPEEPSHQLTICQSSSGEVLCKIEISHTIVDGESWSIILQEIEQLYAGTLVDEKGPAYSDFVAFAQKQPAGASIGYWKSYLNEIEPCTIPVLDNASSASKKLRSLRVNFQDLGNFRQFCELRGVTAANVFHAAWALTLQCYTGSNEVCFGYLASARDVPVEGIESLVGYLVNMLVCRVSFSPEASLQSIVDQVQSDYVESLTHRQTALSEVLHASKISGALFNTILSFRKLPPTSTAEQSVVSIEECAPYYDPTEFPVTINIEASKENFAIDLDYWTDHISECQAENIASTFMQSLKNIVHHSHEQVAQLNNVSDDHLRQILSWNHSMPQMIDRCIHDVIKEQTRKRNSESAVCGWDASFTYNELDAVTSKLSTYLCQQGVRPGSCVCFCFDKSSFTIVAMIGVLRAGGIVVSLDSNHPAAALEMRIQDTRSKYVLCSPNHARRFENMVPNVIAVDRQMLESLPASELVDDLKVRPSDPCFVVYTSGSTGKPKGVVLEHRALVTSARAHGSAVGFNPNMRCLQFASYTFDNSLEEIFTTLMHGGTVCVPSDHERLYDLAGAINRLGATFMDLTPTVATYLEPSQVPTITSMVFGGEALTKRALEIWGDKVQISVMYGPSECCVNSTHRGDVRRSSETSSIGHAIGCLAWIVDGSDHDRLVPIGCEGELLLEGPIMAREYLNDAEKTSKAFIKNPSWAQPSSTDWNFRRFYKTGDLVRYNSDGSIAYLGRKDQQIKLNGQRIELGEIEYHVRSELPEHWQFAVELVTPGSEESAKALALFLCPESADGVPGAMHDNTLLPLSPDVQSALVKLESNLPTVLPAHMVPSMYIPLVKLPLSSSGKLDRRRLKATVSEMTEEQKATYRLAGGNGRAPESELEKTVAQFWESVLDLPPGTIGMDAQFFKMGGDSIAAIRLVTAARSKNIQLTVAKIFRQATLSEMCSSVVQSGVSKLDEATTSLEPFTLLPSVMTRHEITKEVACLCKIDENAIEDAYPCTSIQEGLIALSAKQPGAYVNKSSYLLDLIDLPKFRQAWEIVVAQENILRTRIVFVDSIGFLQVVVKESISWFEGELDGEPLLPAYNGDKLTNYAIVRTGTNQHSFVWTIHHALYDGWSMPIVLQKVKAYYQGSTSMNHVTSPTYPRFIGYLSTLSDKDSEDFWRVRLADITAQQFPTLPTRTYQPFATCSFSDEALFAQKSASEITKPSLIRAAWALAVAAYSNSDDVVFAETVTGRDAPVASILDIVGPTIATVPTRITIDRGLDVNAFLKRLQDVAAETLPHQQLGLQRIKKISPDTAKACEFQNLIAINGEASEQGDRFWNLESGSAKGAGFHTYALMITFDIEASKVQFEVQYDPEVVSEWQLRRLLSHFGHVLRQIGSQSTASTKLGDLETLNPEDKSIIKQWNAAAPKSVDGCIHDIVAEQVKAQSDAPAICAWDAHYTYAELDRCATSFACFLAQRGMGPQSSVPIIFEKSSVMVIVQLAILKVGAAFVPLDWEAPQARLQTIVKDIGASAVLCSPRHRRVVESLALNPIVVNPQTIARCPQSKTTSRSNASDVAYIVFTSGSTGKPKGVMVQHSAFVTSALAHGPAMNIQSSSRVLQFSSSIFDVSIMDVFTTLILGGCVCIPDESTRLNNTSKAINEMNVNWAFLTPSFAQLIQPSNVPGLKTLVLGGEAVTRGHASAWLGHTTLMNAYGPSECSVLATVNPRISSVEEATSIGEAVGGRCWIVDRSNPHRLVPVGSIGELVVEGPILAKGYLHDNEKTVQSFVSGLQWATELFGSSTDLDQQRFYKTGDLVRYLENGSFDYIGRKDNQVKLHGQRMELSEVEHCLQLDPLVRHAVALVPPTGLCAERLTAVISLKHFVNQKVVRSGLKLVAKSEAAPITEQLYARLGGSLQAYMIPSELVIIDQIPLLPSGKLDRRQVAKWIENMTDDVYRELHNTKGDDHEVEATETEKQLQEILAQVLDLPLSQVHLRQSFAQLGGDSILAIQTVSRCRAKGLGLTVQNILRSPSISHLASKTTLPQVAPSFDEQAGSAFPLSPVQMLFFECVGENVNHFNQSVALRFKTAQDLETVRAATSKLIDAHSMLRARFDRKETGTWTQQTIRSGFKPSNFTFHPGLSSLREISHLVEQSQKSLDISDGTVFKVDFFEAYEGGGQLLVLIAHHLVIDVVSWGIIVQDLEQLMSSSQHQIQPSLPFQLWSQLQHQKAQEDISTAVRYDGHIPPVDLAYWGMVEKANVHGDVQDEGFELDVETTKVLLGPCHESLGTDPVDVFLGCILHSFGHAFVDRMSPPSVFNEAHGREAWDSSIDLSRTVGWFTTIAPFSLPAESSQSMNVVGAISWVKDLRRRLPGNGRSSFAHRYLTSQGRERVSRDGPMEILFNYLGQDKQFNKSNSLLSLVEDISRPFDIGAQVPRLALFDISAMVMENKLRFTIGYNRRMQNQRAIRSWTTEIERSLRRAAGDLLNTSPRPTFSNFPLLPMTHDGLSKLRDKLPAAGLTSLNALEDVYNCSPMQEGVLLGQLKNPDHYRYSTIFRVQNAESGPFDTKKLARAWRAVVRRHASLRTVFVQGLCQDGQVGQAVIKDVVPRIARMRCGEADALMTLGRQKPIDFSEPQPPHRLTICESSSGQTFCKLEMNHAICDGTSVPLIFRDLTQAFNASLPHEETGPLYSDYVSYLQQISRQEALRYWRTYLQDFEPCYFPALAEGASATNEIRSIELELTSISALQPFCIENGVTLSNLFQLVWSLVLRAYTGSSDVCFGYLASGRDVPVPAIQDAVGLFANILVCRSLITNETPVRQALQQIQSDFAQSMEYQTFSLADIQHELSLSGKALFNTAFSFQRRQDSPRTDASGLTYDILETEDPSEYGLTVNVEAYRSSIKVHFTYWTGFISAERVADVASMFECTVASVLRQANASQTISSIGSCIGRSLEQILDWNCSPLPKVDQCVHDIIAENAYSRALSTPAVCSWDQNLTYAELVVAADRLAAHLIPLGIGPLVTVPLCLERSSLAVIAMVGILKTGAAFVSLDPSHPESRIQYILENIGAKHVLCSTKYQDKFSGFPSLTTLLVEETTQKKVNADSVFLPQRDIADPAYIIFTSGTTGLPKGTIISHAAFATSAIEHARAMAMRESSRVLQFSNFVFDASIMEILTTLIVGGCVCIPSEAERMNDIPGAIRRMSVNWTLLTPAVASLLQPETVPTLRVLVTGGEAMHSGHISKWKRHVSVINAYGPSETAVIATVSTKVDENGLLVNEDPTTIGHAVGSRSWVVNPTDHDQLVPIGCIGELVVEGHVVANGYLNEKEKTAMSFITNPAWAKFGKSGKQQDRATSMYKTGDLVKYNPDGSLRYIARKDTQIKLNGLRIELGDIEHHVQQKMPGSIPTTVDVVSPPNQSKAITVFFVPRVSKQEAKHSAENSTRSDQGTDDSLLCPMSPSEHDIAATLKASLGGALPSYMIPSLYIPVKRIPTTSSGKVDRRKLRESVDKISGEDATLYSLASLGESEAPTTEMEVRLQKLWERILGASPNAFVKDDNFFARGADSVQAMRLVAAARDDQIRLTVLDVFRKPKLSEMACACTDLEDGDETDLQPFSLLPQDESADELLEELASQCRVEKNEVADAYPCTSLQEGLLTLTIKQPGAYTAHNVFRLPEAVDLAQFKAAWESAIQGMDILRTRIVQTNASRFVQTVLRDEKMLWHTAASSNDVNSETVQLPEHNGSPLMRFTIVDNDSPCDRYFVWSIHHALYDGWSMPSMLRKVESIYFEDDSKQLTTPYARFIKYLVGTDMEASKKFWQSRFEELEALPFPKKPISVSDTTSNQTIQRSLDLPKEAAPEGITLPTIIRATWALLLAAHTGAEDVVFGETLTGRDIPVDGIIDIVGPTLTTVPTRVQIDPTASTLEYLHNVSRTAINVIPFQHVGLQHIRRLNDETAAACDFQNLLVIQMAEEEEGDDKLWDPQNTGVGSNFFTYPLVLECKATESQIHFDAHFNDAVISRFHVERLLFQFNSVFTQLRSTSTSHSHKVSEVEVTSAQDLELIREWSIQSPQVVSQCIHELFLGQAKEKPEAQAVCAWDGNFTYYELQTHAQRLASYLKQHGVGPEVLVPFCTDKSRWSVVAQLGILMADGAMVPLDPSHPVTRHSEIIKDTQARLMLCSPQYADRYSPLIDQLIPIDEQVVTQLSAAPSTTQETNQATSKNTAYCLYTSGSTGKPKGVVVEHQAFCTSSHGYTRAMLMDPTSRVFNFASLTFDVGLMENLSPLTIGACVCIPSTESKLNDVSSAIRDLQASWAFLTPSVANIVNPSQVPLLDVLVCGGEAMGAETVSKWADKLKLVNGYGPTEASVISVANPNVSQEKNPSRIGRAHPTSFAWVTDPQDHNRLAPLGCAGELVLGGSILAREYLHDSKKTAAAFIENVDWMRHFIADKPSLPSRIYKTGDLVQYDEDGAILFMGRKDNQIKLHGQRMELEEIEHRLEVHPRIRHVLVMLPKSGIYKQRLVAVLSLADFEPKVEALAANKCMLFEDGTRTQGAQKHLSDIRSSLTEQLPSYMVPSTWVTVETVPIMVSGKLDRKQVARWIETMQESDRQRLGPAESQNEENEPIEGTVKILRNIWCTIFNAAVEKINPNSSFIAQGGDSLIAMSALPQCRKMGIRLSLQEILQSKSLFQLAKLVDSRGGSIETAGTALRKEKVDELFDLSPVQQLYFQSATSPTDFTKTCRFNQSQLLRLTQKISSPTLRSAVEAIVRHHSMFRGRFSRNDSGVWQQRIVTDSASSYRFREHSVDNTGAVVPVLADSQTCLDIINGPLLAVDLVNIRGVGQAVSLIAHHLVVDVVSWHIIMQDLEDLLTSKVTTLETPLSFQTWCEMQRDQATQRSAASVKSILPFNVKRADLGFWGMAGRSNTYGDTKHQSFVLDKSLSLLALGECNRALRTKVDDILLTVILSAFNNVFPGRAPPTIFSEGHGRESWDDIDLSRTTGWFTALNPLHVPVESKQDIVDILKRVKDARRSVPGNGRPYFAHRYLTPDGRWRFGDHMPMEIVFNNTGRMHHLERSDSLFDGLDIPREEATAAQTSDVGPDTSRFALFEVSVSIMENQIQFSFIYSQHMKHQESIQRWITECQHTFSHCVEKLQDLQPQPTLGDFPLLPTTYEGLGRHVTEVFPEIGVSNIEEVEEMHVCAPTQEGLLLSQIRSPSQYINYVISEVILADDLLPDPQRLARAWQQVVDRHQTLRTAFVYSVVKDRAFDSIVLKSVDGGARIINCDDSEFKEKFDEISLRDVNLTRRPVLPHQFSICRTTSGKCYVKMELNHAVIDGGSAALITRDLALAYQGRLSNDSKPLYSDYIRYIHSSPLSDGINFWKTYLKDIKGCHLPALGGCAEGEKELLETKMTFDRFDQLHTFSKDSGLTISNVMLTAWAFILRMYISQDDVCFGNLTAGRDADVPGISESVGAYINMMCCRVSFSPEQTLKSLFSKVQADYLESLPHQHCSLAKLQNELGFWGEPIFNTCVSIQNQVSSRDAEWATFTIDFKPVVSFDPTEYALTLNIRTAPGEELIILRHWTSSISTEQSHTLLEKYFDVLNAVLDNPDQTVSQFDARGEIPPEPAPTTIVEETKNVDESSAVVESGSAETLQLQPTILRGIVKECVNEILEQLFKSGELVSYRQNPDEMAQFVTREPDQLAQKGQLEGRVRNQTERQLGQRSQDNEEKRRTLVELPRPSDLTLNSLRSLWSAVLDTPEKKIHDEDSFFAMGGDSVRAMTLVGIARESGMALTVGDIFNAPSILDLAVMIEQSQSTTTKKTKTTKTVEHSTGTKEVSVYRRYSLLDTSNVESFIQDHVCPRISVFRGGIVDVLPTTDFQALSIAGTFVDARWMMNYFFFEGTGPLNLVRLKKSAQQVVDANDILRTVFVPYEDRFLQVVLRKHRPQFQVLETDQDLDEYTHALCYQDRENMPRIGEPFIRFTILKQKSTEQHRIVLRLSHAQYDGVCLSKLIDGLQVAYEGKELALTPPFSNFMMSANSKVGDQRYNYWQKLLQGSSRTEVVRRERPDYKPSELSATMLRKTIKIPPTAIPNFTPATVMKSAWALTIAQMSGRSDIVFGNVTTGRNSALPGIENIVGPCMNMIPVRVQFAKQWTALDLLRQVQNQQVAGMPYESLGFREIIKNCTDWPDWSYFTSVVQHQSVQQDHPFRLGSTDYKVGAIGTQESLADLTVVSVPRGKDEVEVTLSFIDDEGELRAYAESAFSMLCDLAENFASDPDIWIPSPKDLSNLPPQTLRQGPEPGTSAAPTTTLRPFGKRDILAFSELLGRGWRAVLRGAATDASDVVSLDLRFHELGGDFVGLAQLAAFLEAEGHAVRVEDLMARPTMGEQIALLCQRKARGALQASSTSTLASTSEEEQDAGRRAVAEQLAAAEPERPPIPLRRESSFWDRSKGLARKMVVRKSRRQFVE